jgi:hypothetical protein
MIIRRFDFLTRLDKKSRRSCERSKVTGYQKGKDTIIIKSLCPKSKGRQ